MTIDLYDLKIKCTSNSEEVIPILIRPFKYFIDSQTSKLDIEIEVFNEEIPYHDFPDVPSSFSTPRNIIYVSNQQKYIDFFGKGMIIEELDQPHYKLYSNDINFLQEAFYLMITSLFGQYCDKSSMMRIHALALSYKDTALLMPMPPGSGKSTMGMALLERKGFKLMADDEPILKKDGHLYPFPIRVGTLDSERIKSIPKKHVYEIDRMEFGKKYFIDYDYWEDKLEHRPLNKTILFLAERKLNGGASIHPSSKFKALKSLIRDAVIGVGLYQGVEFVFTSSTWEVLKKVKVGWMRFWLAWRLVLNSEIYTITLSRDISRNVDAIVNFIQSRDY